MPTQRVGDLEIDQNLSLQQKEWLIQRVAWVALALLLLAGLLGVFGNGPLSDTTAGDADGPLRAEYPRFARFQAPLTVRFHIGPEAIQDGEARIGLSRSYVDSVRIERIDPEPDRVEAGEGVYVYVFTVADPEQAATVSFHLQPEAIGSIQGRAEPAGGPALDFGHFVYP